MNKNLLIIYNTCGISGQENVNYYIEAISSLLNQRNNKHKILISGCLNNEESKRKLKNAFGDSINYNFIDEKLPVNVTFNKSVQEAVKKFGKFEGYLYIDSGINFLHDNRAVEKLYDLHSSGFYAMTSSRTNTDAGTFLWFQQGKDQHDESGQEILFKDNHLVIPIGKTVNLHCQIFDNSLFEAFNGRLMPDIFASHCTESIFSYLCAAVRKKFIVHKDVIASHLTGMDGASSGFRPEWNSFPPWQHTFRTPAPQTINNIISDPEAYECGFGYEECQNILSHNPQKYLEDGSCIDPDRLKIFLQKNVFLTNDYLDYEQIVSNFS